MASRAEEVTSRLLGAVLADVPAGADIPESEQFRGVLAGLERFVPDVLGGRHSWWRGEGLDGIFPVVARKTGEAEAELYGACVIISDQSLTPLHVRLQLSPFGGEISWMECRLGERGPGGMVRAPFDRLHAMSQRLRLATDPTSEIAWAFHVTFGRRRS